MNNEKPKKYAPKKGQVYCQEADHRRRQENDSDCETSSDDCSEPSAVLEDCYYRSSEHPKQDNPRRPKSGKNCSSGKKHGRQLWQARKKTAQEAISLLFAMIGIAAATVQILMTETPDGVPTTVDCPVIAPGHGPDLGLPCITIDSDVEERAVLYTAASTFNTNVTLPLTLIYEPASNYFDQADDYIHKFEVYLFAHWKEIISLCVALGLVKSGPARLLILIVLVSYLSSNVQASEIDVDIRDTLHIIRDSMGNLKEEGAAKPYGKLLYEAKEGNDLYVEVTTAVHFGCDSEQLYGHTLVNFNNPYTVTNLNGDHFHNNPYPVIWIKGEEYRTFDQKVEYFTTSPTRLTTICGLSGGAAYYHAQDDKCHGLNVGLTRAELNMEGKCANPTSVIVKAVTSLAYTKTVTGYKEIENLQGNITLNETPYQALGTQLQGPTYLDYKCILNGTWTFSLRCNLKGTKCSGDIRGKKIKTTGKCEYTKEKVNCVHKTQSGYQLLMNFIIIAIGLKTGNPILITFGLLTGAEALSSGCISLPLHDILTTGTTSWTEFTVTHGQCVSVKATGKPAVSFTYVGADYQNTLIPDRAFILNTQVSQVEFHSRCPTKGTAICDKDHQPNTVTTYTFNDRGWGNGCGLFAKGSICGTIELEPVVDKVVNIYDIDYTLVDHKLEVSLASGKDQAQVITVPGIATSDTEINFDNYGILYLRCSPATTTKWTNSKWTVFVKEGKPLDSDGWAIPRDAFRVLNLPWMSLDAEGQVAGNLLEPEKSIRWGNPRPTTIDYSIKNMGVEGLQNQFGKYPHYPVRGFGPFGVEDVLNCRAKTADLRWYGREVAPCVNYPIKIQYDEHPQPDQNGLINVAVVVEGLTDACRLTSKLTRYNEDRATEAGLQMGTDPIVTPDNSTAMIHYRIPSGLHYLWIGQGDTMLKIDVENKRSAIIGSLSDLAANWRNFIGTAGLSSPDDVAGGIFGKIGKSMGNLIRGLFHNAFGANGVIFDYLLVIGILYVAAMFDGKIRLTLTCIALLIFFATYVSGAEAGVPEYIGEKAARFVDSTVGAFKRGYSKAKSDRYQKFDPEGFFVPSCRRQMAYITGYLKPAMPYIIGIVSTFVALMAPSLIKKNRGIIISDGSGNNQATNRPDVKYLYPLLMVLVVINISGLIKTRISEGTYSPDCMNVFQSLGIDWEVDPEYRYTVFTYLWTTAAQQRGLWRLLIPGIDSLQFFIVSIGYLVAIAAVVLYFAKHRANIDHYRKIILATAVICLASSATADSGQRVQWQTNSLQGTSNSTDSFSRVNIGYDLRKQTDYTDTVFEKFNRLKGHHHMQHALDGIAVAIVTLPNTKFTSIALMIVAVLKLDPMAGIYMSLLSSGTLQEITLAYAFGERLAPVLASNKINKLLNMALLYAYVTTVALPARIFVAMIYNFTQPLCKCIRLVTTVTIMVALTHIWTLQVTISSFAICYLMFALGCSHYSRAYGIKATTPATPITLGVVAIAVTLSVAVPAHFHEMLCPIIGLAAYLSWMGEKYIVIVPKTTTTIVKDLSETPKFPYDKNYVDTEGDFIPQNDDTKLFLIAMGAALVGAAVIGPIAPILLAGYIGYSHKRNGAFFDVGELDNPENREEGPVHIRRTFYGFYTKTVGAGYVYKGVLHTNEHVTCMNPIEWAGSTWHPCTVDKKRDVITYGGDYCFEEMKEDEAEIIVIRDGCKIKQKTYLQQTSEGFVAPAEIPPGSSGSPIFQEGKPVGITGNMAGIEGSEYAILDAPPEPAQPTEEMFEAVSTTGRFIEYVSHPGSGKTRNIILKLAKRAKAYNRHCIIAVPTRVVAQEVANAFKDITYVSQTQAFRTTCRSSKITIVCHATLAKSIIMEGTTLKGLVIMDESHFADEKTQFLHEYLKNEAEKENISYISLTATGENLSDDNSNFGITDYEITEREIVEYVKDHPDRKIMIFVPTRKFAPVDKTKGEAGKLKIETINLNSATFENQNTRAKVMNQGVIIATNIAEVGGNYNLDAVIDFGKTTFPIRNGNIVTLDVRKMGQASRIQRRGRVGRNRTGEYWYVSSPAEYRLAPADAVLYDEASILLEYVGLPPHELSEMTSSFTDFTQEDRSNFIKLLQSGMSVWFAYSLVRNAAYAYEDLKGDDYTDGEGHGFSLYDMRETETIAKMQKDPGYLEKLLRKRCSAPFKLGEYYNLLTRTVKEDLDIGADNIIPAIIALIVAAIAVSIFSKNVTSITVNVVENVAKLVSAVIQPDNLRLVPALIYMHIGADVEISGHTVNHTTVALLASMLTTYTIEGKGVPMATAFPVLLSVVMAFLGQVNLPTHFQDFRFYGEATDYFAIPGTLVAINALLMMAIYGALAETYFSTSILTELVRFFDDTKTRNPPKPVTMYKAFDIQSLFIIIYILFTRRITEIAVGAALGFLLLLVPAAEGVIQARIAYLGGKESIGDDQVPEPNSNESRKTSVRLIVAGVGIIGCSITRNLLGLVTLYPLLSYFAVTNNYIPNRDLAKQSVGNMIIAIGTGDIMLLALTIVIMWNDMKKSGKRSDGTGTSYLAQCFAKWKLDLNKMGSEDFKKYKKTGVCERPQDVGIASRGAYKMNEAIQRGFINPKGRMLDLGCGAGGFSQRALATGKVTKCHGITWALSGHHTPRIEKLQSLGHNLFTWEAGDYKTKTLGEYDTLVMDIGESDNWYERETARTLDLVKDLKKVFEEVNPSEWLIKIHAPAHLEVLMHLRALQTVYGGGFFRSSFSRNSTSEIYYASGARATPETCCIRLHQALVSRMKFGDPKVVSPLVLPTGQIRPTAPVHDANIQTKLNQNRVKTTDDQPYHFWYKWGETREEEDTMNSEIKNPIIESITRGLRALVPGANEWAVTETSSIGLRKIFRDKIDTATVPMTPKLKDRYTKIANFVGKTKPKPRVLTDEDVVNIFRNDAAVGQLHNDKKYPTVVEAFADDNFWKVVRQEEKLHSEGKCSRGIFNTISKTEKKRLKGSASIRPASRMIAYLPLVERFLEQKYLGWINQDCWTHREILKSGIGGMPIHYLGGLMEEFTQPDREGYIKEQIVQSDIAGWDTRISYDMLDQEEQMLVKDADPKHQQQIRALYHIYKFPMIMLKTPRPNGLCKYECLQTVGQRMSGTVVTYTMNTVTNTIVNLLRMWESEGKPDLDTWLKENGNERMSRMVISGDDMVSKPLDPQKFASSLDHLHQLGLYRKDVSLGDADEVINNFDNIEMCSHQFRILKIGNKKLAIVVKPESEILGKMIFSVGFIQRPAIPALAKSMLNYTLLIFFAQRDVRYVSRAGRSCVDRNVVCMGKIKDPYITDEPWMSSEAVFDIWKKIWIHDNPFADKSLDLDIETWKDIPYLPQIQDRQLGSAIGIPGRSAWKKNLPKLVRNIRQYFQQSDCDDEIEMKLPSSYNDAW